ncbi:MAG: isochorismatase family protein [Alphaproteobacteria bacterium]|nr:isochorismatase family protein [Alphaproteobacteria bacterium]
MLLRAENSFLAVIDVQERLLPVMADPRKVLWGTAILMRAALRLGLPMVVTEQYPQGLGPTQADLRPFIPEGALFTKLHFASTGEEGFLERVAGFGRRQAVLAGIESHICVTQTALGLKAAGYEVFVAFDACSSRQIASIETARQRLAANGIEIVTVEMVVFEWLGRAATPEFKELSALIK